MGGKMMYDELPPLEIFGTYDRSTPNSERIVLRANQPVNLAEYFLILGLRAPLEANYVYPIPDQSIWLGPTAIEMPSWVFVYTGNGTNSVSKEKHTGDPIFTVFWNRSEVILTHDDIIPTLLHFDRVEIGNKPNKKLQDKKEDGTTALDIQERLAKLLESFEDLKNKD